MGFMVLHLKARPTAKSTPGLGLDAEISMRSGLTSVPRERTIRVMDSQSPFNTENLPAYLSEAPARASFIRRTYAHVAVAIGLFAFLSAALINSGFGAWFTTLASGNKYSWLLVLGAFMIVSTVADRWARSDASSGKQYFGLGLYIVALAVLFSPLLTIASVYQPDAITQAAVLTACLVAGLTGVVFMTKKDFSFLGPILGIAGMVALGVIACAILFGFTLGTLFAAIMVVFAGGSVLYSTSNLLHRYRPDQHVAAALSLFASIGLLFWYILQIILSRR